MFFYLYRIIFFYLILINQVISQFYSSPSQYLALKTIYDSFNGQSWIWSNTEEAWNFDSFTENNPCSSNWEGISCQTYGCGPNNYNTYCPIVSIELTSKNLTGNFDTLYYYEDSNEISELKNNQKDSLLEYNNKINQFNENDLIYTTSTELFTNLSTVLNFSLGDNNIYGELPSFQPLEKIMSLNLTSNYFTGQIPNELIPDNSNMIVLYLSNNYLTGPIPSGFFLKLTKIEYFSIYMNQINGTINSDIRYLKSLIYLNIANNQFSGSLPISSLNNFNNLKQFIGYSNKFYGKIPDFLDSDSSLESIYLYDNAFTGSIPSSYCELNSIKILSLGDNILTGTVPSCFGNLENLNILSLQSNYLKKNINSIFNSTLQLSLSYIDLSDNAITGEIPNEIFALKSLYLISLAKNCFHGNLPSNICDINSTNLQVLSMDGLMASTKCKGGKDDYYFHPIFSSSNFESYSSFSFSFSTDGIFTDYSKYNTNNKNRKLTEEDLVESSNLDTKEYKISVPSLIPYLSKSFFLIDWIRALKFFFSNPIAMKGSLPECIWWLPNLTVMHFSGNGLKGNLPIEFPISYYNDKIQSSYIIERQNNLPTFFTSHSKSSNKRLKLYHLEKKQKIIDRLTRNSINNKMNYYLYEDQSYPILRDTTSLYSLKDVCLAYNRLSGTVPDIFNSISLQNLDLSFNKLTGSANNLNNFPNVTSIDPSNTSVTNGVDIRSNRFSGEIPKNWISAPNLNVLSGNLFRCKADHSDLPNSDPDLTAYNCGSEALNSALYVTGISFFLMIFTVLVIIYSFKGMGELPLEIWKFLRAVHYTYYYSRRICIQLDALSEVYSLLWSGEELDYSELTKGMMNKGRNHHQNNPFKQKLQLLHVENSNYGLEKNLEKVETFDSTRKSSEISTSFNIINDYSNNLYRHSSRIQKNESFSARLSISESPNDKSQHISDMLKNSDMINSHQIFEEEDKAELEILRESSSKPSYYFYIKSCFENFLNNLSFTYIIEKISNFLLFLLQLFFSFLHIIFRFCSNLFKEYSPFSSSNIVNISNLPSLKEREYILKYSNLFQYLRLLSKLRILAIIIGLYSTFILLPIYLIFYKSGIKSENNNGSMKYSTHTQVYGWIMTSTYLTGTTSGYVLFFLWASILSWTMLMILMHYHVYLKEEPTGLKKNLFLLSKKCNDFINYFYGGKFKIDIISYVNKKKSYKDKVIEEIEEGTIKSDDFKENYHTQKVNEIEISEDQKDLLKNSSPLIPFQDKELNNSSQINLSTSPNYILEENVGVSLITPTSDFYTDESPTNRYPKRLPPSHKLPSFGPPREYILDRSERKMSMRNFLKYFIIFIINITICIIVNSVYLSGEEDDGGSSSNNSAIFSYKYVIQLFMAIFKIFWNIVILRNIILGFLPYTPTTTRFHLFMLIVNNIITPILTMFITNSSSCFNNLITQNSEVVTTNYYLNMCVESYDHIDFSDQQIYSICTNTMELQNVIEFQPKFVYFFTCKSEFLKRYIPVFIYTYTFLFIFKLFDHNFFIGCSKILPERYTSCYVDGVLLPSWRGKVTFTRLIRSHANMVMLIQHVVVLLTFGLCSPILALLIVIYIILDTTKWQMLITRYIKYDCEGNPFHPIPKNEIILDEEIDDADYLSNDSDIENKNNINSDSVIINEPNPYIINPLFGSNQDDITEIPSISLSIPSSPQKKIRKKKIKQFSSNEFRKKKNEIKKDHFDDARISIISATNASTHSINAIPIKPTIIPSNFQSLNDDKDSKNRTINSSFSNFDINNFYVDDYMDDESVFDDSVNSDNFSDSDISNSSFNSMYSVQGSTINKALSNQIKIEKRNHIHQQLENLRFSNIVLAENENSQIKGNIHEIDKVSNKENNIICIVKTKEEERLEEFHFMMGDSWRCLMNAKWTILYSCMFFYFSMIYDSIGDNKGMIQALFVDSILCGSIVIFVRFFLKPLILKYMEGRVKSHQLFLNTI